MLVGEQKHGNRSGVAECQLAHGMISTSPQSYLSQVLNLHWRSPEYGDLRYRSKQSILSHSEGWWFVGEQKHGNRSGVAECQLAHGMMALRAGKTSIAVCARTSAA